tara:strand:+ start:82 stop:534 length:453 start_codon:yes stop_codon:yes gene_type:complete
MSSNRLIYDSCAYKTKVNESVGPLEYMLNPIRYENCNKCRMELGIIGGSNVSHIKGNLVDLETELKGITRKASQCPSKKYQSPCPTGDLTNCPHKQINIPSTNCGKDRSLDTQMLHLPSCQMIRYKPTPLPDPMQVNNCGKQLNIPYTPL